MSTLKILIIGIKGAMSQSLCNLFLKNFEDVKIVGVDSRKPDNVPDEKRCQFLEIKYSLRSFENLFRNYKFDYVFHLGRMSHVSMGEKNFNDLRYDYHIIETKNILDLCLNFKVKKIVLLSSFHVYGAISDNSVLLKEDAPLRASIKYPELMDVVQMDQVATNWMWKNQNNIIMSVLRPCNIVGSSISNVITRYLKSPYTPTPIDYNPMMQFIHEKDLSNLIFQIKELNQSGVYNVAPLKFLSLREARKIIGKKGIPNSALLLGLISKLNKSGRFHIPEYLIDYMKYSCLIDSSLIIKNLNNFNFEFGPKETLLSLNSL